jgi:hypothetical protein
VRSLSSFAADSDLFRRLIAAIALLCGGASLTLAQPAATFSFPRDPEYLVLEYHQSHEMLPATDPVPLLRIYGDGRVLVHQPAYRIDAGDYELRLSAAELERLVDGLAERNVPRANVADLASARRRENERRQAEDGTVFAISDATVTHLTLHLDSFTPAPGARAISNLSQRIVWANLQSDAERFPELRELADLAAAERELQALVNRPDRRRVR